MRDLSLRGRRIPVMWWLPVLIALAIAAACAEEEAPVPAAATPIASAEHRFTAVLPAGWELAASSLTPTLSNPVEILSAGTVHDARPDPGSCGHMPVGALERMGPRDAFVTLQERLGEPHFPDRPASFALPSEDPNTDASACAENGSRLHVYWFGFRDAHRGFHVLVALGREAPPERRREALALLDSLRFEPGPEGVHLDPDEAVPFEAHGLEWQMPVPPWRHYDWPLTAVHGERLALGTFELERAPPDRNCMPQAAIDAMPDGGSFIYVFEYLDDRVALPERRGELKPGPEESYECLGVSRMVRWRDDGRDFQAHVYLGPAASEELKREALSILNSIRVG